MSKYLILLIFVLGYTSVFSQSSVTISGTVTDKDTGEELIGVSVGVKGTTNGTMTDIDGKYSITIPSGKGTLEFLYLGYTSQEKIITKTEILNITLSPDNFMLDEVVAIGYGTMKRSDLTGAISSVSGDKLKVTPVSGVDQALQGRIAGVTVNSNSGQPGARATIRIRGIGTVLGGADPLFVVDGVMVDNIDFLSPSDIETTDVLKDASATAIYGSRGANGVILITTKKGNKDGKTNITYETYVGWQSRWKKLDLMKRDDFARIKSVFTFSEDELTDYFETGNRDAFNEWIQGNFTGNKSYYFPQIKDAKNPNGFDYSTIDTDWQDVVFNKNAFMQNHYLSVDGGNEKSNYLVSANYFDQDGTLIGSNYKRLTLRVNTSHKVRSWLKVGENLSFTNSSGRNAMNNNAESSVLSSAIAMAPWDPTRYPQGAVSYKSKDYPNGKNLSEQISASSNFKNVVNPLSMVEHSHPKDKWERWVGDVFVELTPIKGLTLRGDVSIDVSNGESRLFKDKYEYSSYDKAEKNYFTASMIKYKTLIYEATANYTKAIGKHDFNVMVGATRDDYTVNGISGSGASILNPKQNNWDLNNVTEDKTPTGQTRAQSRRISVLGRLFYSYDNKYLATFNFRRDGSSKFPEANLWGNFPSLSLAWRTSEESFFEPLKGVFDSFKLRLGWGQIGNDNVGNLSFIPNITSNSPIFVGYPLGSSQEVYYGATMLNYPGAGKWETNEQWNVGIDFTALNGRLYGNIDGFIRNTKDMLMYVSPPAHVGYRHAIVANAGNTRNQGIEVSLEYRDRAGDFDYSVSGNISFIKNELTKLNNGEKIWSYGNIVLNDEGYGINTFWGYKYDGVFKSQDEIDTYVNDKGEKIQPLAQPGDARYKDVNGDGVFDENDKTDIGNPFPWMTYGLNASLAYKGFDLQLFFQGAHGNEIYNAVRLKTEGKGDESTLSTDMRDVWTTSNPDGNIPNPFGNSINSDPSSRFVESGSYLRLKNIQLGYTIPNRLLKNVGINSLRVYVAATNLFTITDYSGYDPEIGGAGVDYGNYPQARTYTIGAKLNF